mgnify:CR=1 FL=1
MDFIRLCLKDFERSKFNLGRQGEANTIGEGSANLPKVSLWLPCFGAVTIAIFTERLKAYLLRYVFFRIDGIR